MFVFSNGKSNLRLGEPKIRSLLTCFFDDVLLLLS